MTEKEIIDMVLAANKPSDLFVGSEWKKEFFKLSQSVHPDVCTDKRANDAMAKLSGFKDLMEKGYELVDESGAFKVFDNKLVYLITDKNRTLLNKSYNNYMKLMSLKSKSADNFKLYLPKSMVLSKDELTINFSHRAIPLTNKKLEQVHINWIFSRLFEASLRFRDNNYSHTGLNPTSVFVVPENHGIIITTFYHMTALYSKVETISAKYRTWYPSDLFSKKIATPEIDLELSKKIGIYLLGDKSTAGTSLKRNKDINQDILTFLIASHENTLENYTKYRDILKKNFKSEFIHLNL